MRYPSMSVQSCLAPSPASRSHLEARSIVERGLSQIMLACEEACAARLTTAEGSAEWHKRTGEILAYGKATSLLCRLQAALPQQELH